MMLVLSKQFCRKTSLFSATNARKQDMNAKLRALVKSEDLLTSP
jgi:hypothetical protein